MIPDDQQDRGTKILIDDLLLKPQSYSREEMLSRVRRLRYHDYKSEDALCSVTLMKHLKGAGFHDMAQNAADGKYDQQKDASDEWAQSEDGKAAFAMAESDPEMKANLDKMKKIMKSGALKDVRYVVPDDGPPEPGTKGEA